MEGLIYWAGKVICLVSICPPYIVTSIIIDITVTLYLYTSCTIILLHF